MKTTTKKELLQKFENQEFVQINFPKVTVTEQFGWSHRQVEKDIADDTVLYMRSEIETLDHFNCVYKDGNKYYLENSTDACVRLIRRVYRHFYDNIKDVEYDFHDLEEAEYCLYLGKYDMNTAKKIMQSRH